MTQLEHQTALIVGVGQGLSAALARLFAEQGFRIALASRDTTKLESLCKQTGAIAIDCDVTDANQVVRLFEQVDKRLPPVDVVVYNPSARSRGPFVELVPADVQRALMVTALGGFLVGQQAARRMLPRRSGAILYTGASASVKGYPQSAPFAMAKLLSVAWCRVWRESSRRRESTWRTSSSMAPFVRLGTMNRPSGPTRCWIPMPSRPRTCTF